MIVNQCADLYESRQSGAFRFVFIQSQRGMTQEMVVKKHTLLHVRLEGVEKLFPSFKRGQLIRSESLEADVLNPGNLPKTRLCNVQEKYQRKPRSCRWAASQTLQHVKGQVQHNYDASNCDSTIRKRLNKYSLFGNADRGKSHLWRCDGFGVVLQLLRHWSDHELLCFENVSISKYTQTSMNWSDVGGTKFFHDWLSYTGNRYWSSCCQKLIYNLFNQGNT